MSSTLTSPGPSGISRLPYWLPTAIIACLIPLITNVLLPTFGVDMFANRIGATTLPTLLSLGLGGLLYVQYLRFSMKHPLMLAIYSAVFIRVLFYLAILLESTGKHLPTRILHMALLLVPTVLLVCQNFKYLNKNYNYFKYITLFFFVFLAYFLLFNYNFVEPGVNVITNTSISQGKINDYFYSFVGMVLVACSFQKETTPEGKFKLFQRFNLFLICFGLIHGLLTLFGFPLGLFTMVVEGFKRSAGMYTHPNEFAKSQGLLLIYFIGLFYSYSRSQKATFLPYKILLVVTIISNILAFLLSMSKNSFASFGVSIALFFAVSLFDPKIRKKVLLPVALFAGLLLALLAGYQIYTGHDLLSTLIDRFNDTRSLEWRYSVWGYLMANIDQSTVWLGHGLTSSNMELYRFLFDTSKQSSQQSIFVHNAFIAFLFDMGLLGLLVFAGFFAAIIHGVRSYLRSHEPMMLAVSCLALYIIICTMVDECITNLDTSLLLWLLVTLIYSAFNAQPTKVRSTSLVEEQVEQSA